MPLPAKNQREKFVDRSIGYDLPALPPLPKIPEAIKNANPALREEWDKFETDLHDFFRGQQTRNYT